LRVWLFKDGEALPVEPNSRRMRTGMLAEALRLDGHEVHWFSSTFLHGAKREYAKQDVQTVPSPGLTLHLLHAGGFSRNLSIERYRFHRRYAHRIADYCKLLAAPDVIVCAFPLIDVADWVVQFGASKRIPVIVDVRDLWPDTILDVFPKWARPAARIALNQDFRRTARLMSRATSITAMSQGVLRWALRYAARPEAPTDRVFPIGFPQRATGTVKPLTPRLEAWLPQISERRLFTYVGTFGHTYDLHGVIDAAKRLSASPSHDLHFVLAGTGPLLQKIKQAAADVPNVTIPGWLEQTDIEALLSRSYAGILPWAGLDDAMPNKFFEYISAGLPVLSSARGELNDLIITSGIGDAFPAGDGAALADAVLTLCREPDRQRRMSQRATSVFAECFREDLVYRDFVTHVMSLVPHRTLAR